MFMRQIFLALLSLSVGLHASELVDRIVATVNTQVILQSDWDDEVRFEAFMSGRNPGDVTVEEKKAALNRLIDQDVVGEQMRMTDLKAASAAEIEKQIDNIKSERLREHPEQAWETTLSRYQLTNKIVEQHVAAELEQFQFIDLRFRPSIQVSAGDVEKYYREQIVPKLPASDPLSLNDAAAKIKEILIQEKINQLLNSWLETIRSQAKIQVLSADQPSDPQPSPQGTR